MKRTLLLVLILVLLVGCNETKLDKNYTADEIIPKLDSNGYVTISVDEAAQKIGQVADVVGVAIPMPTNKALSGITSFANCMQGKGAWSSNAYYHQDEIAFGLAASASTKESTDAMNLIYCAASSFVLTNLKQMSVIGEFEPTLCRWKAKTPNDTLYNVVIASHKGMLLEICNNFPGGCTDCSVILREKST